MEQWVSAFKKFSKNNPDSGDNALGLFSIVTRFNLENWEEFLSEAIIDGSNDKGADILYIDKDEHFSVIAQCYYSSKPDKASAPSNKAATLNQHISWLFDDSNDNTLPPDLKRQKNSFHEALKDPDSPIGKIYLWYVHNCPESKNCENELFAAAKSLKRAISEEYPDISDSIEIIPEEIGATRISDMYNQLSRPILVSEELDISIDQYYEVEGPGWKSIATTVPGTWLQELYNEHEKQIFSANLRGYLGSKKSDGNINSGIKETAESDPANFFVFNNGVTALVNSYAINKNENEAILHISGISIVNGAQTTGALSSAKALSERNDITVGIRFVQSTSNKLIDDIVRYNNSQNKLQAADFRSGDPVQRRLVKEFESIDGVHYQGGRRGGAEDIIRRRNALPPGAVAQSIAAFHGQALEAIRGYSKLWTDESRYRKVFEESITAKHVLFCYSLISAIREKKMSLNNCIRSSNGRNITKRDEKTLELLNIRGAQYLLAQSISNAFEEVVGKQILNRYKLRFSEPISEEEYKRKWNELLTLLFVSSKRIVDEIGSNRRVTNEIVSKVSDVVSEILGLLNEEGRLLEFRSYIEGY